VPPRRARQARRTWRRRVWPCICGGCRCRGSLTTPTTAPTTATTTATATATVSCTHSRSGLLATCVHNHRNSQGWRAAPRSATHGSGRYGGSDGLRPTLVRRCTAAAAGGGAIRAVFGRRPATSRAGQVVRVVVHRGDTPHGLVELAIGRRNARRRPWECGCGTATAPTAAAVIDRRGSVTHSIATAACSPSASASASASATSARGCAFLRQCGCRGCAGSSSSSSSSSRGSSGSGSSSSVARVTPSTPFPRARVRAWRRVCGVGQRRRCGQHRSRCERRRRGNSGPTATATTATTAATSRAFPHWLEPHGGVLLREHRQHGGVVGVFRGPTASTVDQRLWTDGALRHTHHASHRPEGGHRRKPDTTTTTTTTTAAAAATAAGATTATV